MNASTHTPPLSRSILLVEDDRGLCRLMAAFFAQKGFSLESAHDGGSGLKRAIEGQFDVIILDVMLPVLDGFAVLHQIRKRSAVPIIMLTARTEQSDRIAGLDAGADDYLPKPFGPEELLSRIRAVLRRVGVGATAPAQIEAGGVRINSHARLAWWNDRPLDLTGVEFDILEFLVRAAGRVVARDELTTMLYQRKSTPYERGLDVHVSHLRTKLNDTSHSLIRTIRGSGYVFGGEVLP
jgi:two-component system, OmpR family, response regulator CpxR